MREETRYPATSEQCKSLLDLATKECLGEGVKDVMLHIASYDGDSAERYVNFCIEKRNEDIAFNQLMLVEDISMVDKRSGTGRRKARVKDYIF